MQTEDFLIAFCSMGYLQNISPTSAWERHVVLVCPEVHWNTGNIGRTCLGTGACLHLIEPLGFSLDHKHLKRAGLDYWPKVRLNVWKNFTIFLEKMNPQENQVALFSKNGRQSLWSIKPCEKMFLVFGSETRGIPDDILQKYPGNTYHIPITTDIRSLNLSTAVGIALYESLRMLNPLNEWTSDHPFLQQ